MINRRIVESPLGPPLSAQVADRASLWTSRDGRRPRTCGASFLPTDVRFLHPYSSNVAARVGTPWKSKVPHAAGFNSPRAAFAQPWPRTHRSARFVVDSCQLPINICHRN